MIRASWQTRCDKLEQHITKMMAYNLPEIFNNPKERSKFSKLIKESAERIKERQDTDTIELVDDIRYYLAKNMPLIKKPNLLIQRLKMITTQMILIYIKMH